MTPSGARPEIRVPRWIKYYTQSTIVCIIWILWFFGPVLDAYYDTRESKVFFLVFAFQHIIYRLRPVSMYEWGSYSALRGQWRLDRTEQSKLSSPTLPCSEKTGSPTDFEKELPAATSKWVEEPCYALRSVTQLAEICRPLRSLTFLEQKMPPSGFDIAIKATKTPPRPR